MNILTPDQLKLATFLPWLKTRFRVYLDSTSFIELELAEANEISGGGQADLVAKRPVQETFSLIFNGPDNRLLPQRIYSFEHDGLGQFDLFIVPIGRMPGCIQYQAIFNRLVQAA